MSTSSFIRPQRFDCRPTAPVAAGARDSWLRLHAFAQTSAVIVAAIFFATCTRISQTTSGPLPQRGYVWQRDWTPAVNGAVFEAQKRMDGIILLGAEISWIAGKPEVVKTNINWRTLEPYGVSYGIAMRIAPYPGPLPPDDTTAQFIVRVAKSLIDLATSHGVALSEFQIDFDCPQKNLRGYRGWLHSVREAVHPVRLVLTTLPAWLDDPEFVPLVREADGYVLQVHSVPILGANSRRNLCDAQSARTWVKRAAHLGIPFSVALPTYRCAAGYDPSGKLLSVAMDSVQPAWPPRTRVLEFETDADDMATLINEWHRARPPQLREVIWYRIPVSTDLRNWHWATLSAVMSGRKPLRQLEVLQEGENPIDLSIVNTGEAEEELDSAVTAIWNGAATVTADALTGWTVDITHGRAIFRNTSGHQMRLSPGGKRQIGWLRYEQPVTLQLKLAKNE